MKSLKYNLAILASVLVYLFPLGGAILIILAEFTNTFGYPWDEAMPIIGVVLIVLGLALMMPLRKWRVATRREVEYDEFGISKSKGNYEYLSKAERDKMDLQKTADMERLLSATAVKKMMKPGSTNPMKDLQTMIGLEPVKQKVEEMVARMEFETQEMKGMNKKKKAAHINKNLSGRHMVFFGSPGTGKTSVARIITGFLYKYGYIKENKCFEIDGNFLKAGTESALKTELVCRQAHGGVLFIDEAYALMESGDGSGEQAIATLIKQMEDNRDKFIIILAGYTHEMKMLIDKNPGFESRVRDYLNFPDYNAMEMREIASQMANANNFVIDNSAFDVFDALVARERRLKSFGNGRTARNIVDKAIDRHTLNCARGIVPQEKRYCLISQDFQNLQLGTISANIRDTVNSTRPTPNYFR